MKRLFFSILTSCTILLISCNGKTSSTGQNSDYEKSKETNKAVIKAMTDGDWASLDKYIAADAVDHAGTTGELKGLEAIKQDMMKVKQAFPDMKFEILGTAQDGDLFFSWTKFTGTQKGDFMGMPSTNKEMTMSSVDVVKIKDGKMTEHWAFMDMAEAMKMGAGAAGGGDHMGSDTSKMAADTMKH